MSEKLKFDELVASNIRLCSGPENGGCACMGGCLQNHLAKLRRKYDKDYEGDQYWFSDQLHGSLKIRPGDSGRHGANLTPDNYWTGVQ